MFFLVLDDSLVIRPSFAALRAFPDPRGLKGVTGLKKFIFGLIFAILSLIVGLLFAICSVIFGLSFPQFSVILGLILQSADPFRGLVAC